MKLLGRQLEKNDIRSLDQLLALQQWQPFGFDPRTKVMVDVNIRGT